MPRKSMNHGNPVQFVRRVVGFSQAEFAAKLRLSRSTIGKLESQQEGYAEPSDRVRARIAREFGAILQFGETTCPAVDIEDQPYSLASYAKHRKPSPTPGLNIYPAGTLGTAMEWLATVSHKTGYSGSLNEALGKALEWLSGAPGFSEALEKEILEQDNLSPQQVNAANWLLRYFKLSRVQSTVPRLSFDQKSGEPIYEIELPPSSASPSEGAINDPAKSAAKQTDRVLDQPGS